MNLNRAAALLIAASIISTIFIVKSISAQDTIENFVDSTIDVELESATDFTLSTTMDVSQIAVFGTVYDNNDIKALASSTDKNDTENMGAIKLILRQLLDKQISNSFKGANVKASTSKPTYENGLFKSEYSINLTSGYFGMKESVDAYSLVNGVLDMSAIVNYSFNLSAEPGWNNTYTFDLGSTLKFKYTTGTPVTQAGDKIRWDVKNPNGDNQGAKAELQLKKASPTTKLTSDNIFLEFELNSKDAAATALSSDVLLKGIDIRAYNILPSFIYNLDFISADGIRLFVDNELFSWDELYEKTVRPLESTIKSTIEESSLNQTIDFVFSWDNQTTTDCEEPYEVLKMNDVPYAKAILTDEKINLKFCNISSRALFGLINSGADGSITKGDVNFGDNLNKIGYNYNITLHLPDNLYLDGKNNYTWNESIPIAGAFESDIASTYSQEDKNAVVEIEIKTTDLNLLSFLTGKTELTFGLDLNGENNYNVTTIPGEFTLPEKISLNLLSSDAFRLCAEEKVFDKDSIDAFLNGERTDFDNIMKRVLPGVEVSTDIKRDIFERSLSWDRDITKMDGTTPIKTALYSHSSYPVSFDFSFVPPKFEIPERTFNLSGMQNKDVIYKIIFPSGISIEVDDQLNKSSVTQMGDGRQYFEVYLSASESNTSVDIKCKMIPSALFIIGVFMPCIISIIITVILVIVVILIRKRRRERGSGRKRSAKKEEEETGYEGEDYYIPPPPDSK